MYDCIYLYLLFVMFWSLACLCQATQPRLHAMEVPAMTPAMHRPGLLVLQLVLLEFRHVASYLSITSDPI